MARLTLARSDFENSVFKLVIAQFKAEQHVSSIVQKAVMIIYGLVLFEGTCPKIDLFQILGLDKTSISRIFNLASFIVFVAYFVMQIMAAWICRGLDLKNKLPTISLVMAHFNTVLVYAIYPMQLLSFVTTAYYDPNSYFFGIGMASMIIGSIEVSIILLVLRNTMPCESYMACLDSYHELPMFVGSIVAIILGLTEQYDSNSRLHLVYQSTISVINVLQLIYTMLNPKYWHRETNEWFVDLYSLLAVLNIWNLALIIKGGYKLHFLYIPIGFTIVQRFCTNFMHKNLTLDIFNSSIGSTRLIQSVVTAERTFKNHKAHLQQDAHLYIHYTSIVNMKMQALGKSEAEIQKSLVDYHAFVGVLQTAVQENTTDINVITLSSVLWMVTMFDDLLGLKRIITRCKNYAEKYGFLGRLRMQHIMSLLDAKVDDLYQERLTAADTQDLTIDTVYASFSHMSVDRNNEKKSFFDVAIPLYHKQIFETATEMLAESVKSRQKLFEYIVKNRNSSVKLDSLALFNYNLGSRKSKKNLEELIRSQISSKSKIPQYYYPLLYIYHAVVCHDSTKSRSMLERFKKNANAIIYARNRGESTVRKQLFTIDAAILRIGETQNGHLGLIIDASPTSEKLLGHWNDERSLIQGRHIHQIFLDVMIPFHEKMMKQSALLQHIVNSQRHFVVKRLDGAIEEVDFILKVAPSVDNGLQFIACLRQLRQNDLSLVLLGQKMEVLGMEKSFYKGLDRLASDLTYDDISLSTPQIPQMHKLLTVIADMKATFAVENIKADQNTLLNDLIQFSEVVLEFNRQCKILYCMEDHGSLVGKKNIRIGCRITPLKFGDMTLVKVYVNFQGIRAFDTMHSTTMNMDADPRSKQKASERFRGVQPQFNQSKESINIFKREYQGSMSNIANLIDFNKDEDASTIFYWLDSLLAMIDKETLELCPTSIRRIVADLYSVANFRTDTAGNTGEEGTSNADLTREQPNLIISKNSYKHELSMTADDNRDLKVNRDKFRVQVQEPMVKIAKAHVIRPEADGDSNDLIGKPRAKDDGIDGTILMISNLVTGDKPKLKIVKKHSRLQ